MRFEKRTRSAKVGNHGRCYSPTPIRLLCSFHVHLQRHRLTSSCCLNCGKLVCGFILSQEMLASFPQFVSLSGVVSDRISTAETNCAQHCLPCTDFYSVPHKNVCSKPTQMRESNKYVSAEAFGRDLRFELPRHEINDSSSKPLQFRGSEVTYCISESLERLGDATTRTETQDEVHEISVFSKRG